MSTMPISSSNLGCISIWNKYTVCNVVRRSMPVEAHERLKRRLSDLLQRNREFRALLLAGNVRPTPIGGLTFGTLSTDEEADVLPSSPGKFFDMVRTSAVYSVTTRCGHVCTTFSV